MVSWMGDMEKIQRRFLCGWDAKPFIGSDNGKLLDVTPVASFVERLHERGLDPADPTSDFGRRLIAQLRFEIVWKMAVIIR